MSVCVRARVCVCGECVRARIGKANKFIIASFWSSQRDFASTIETDRVYCLYGIAIELNSLFYLFIYLCFFHGSWRCCWFRCSSTIPFDLLHGLHESLCVAAAALWKDPVGDGSKQVKSISISLSLSIPLPSRECAREKKKIYWSRDWRWTNPEIVQ